MNSRRRTQRLRQSALVAYRCQTGQKNRAKGIGTTRSYYREPDPQVSKGDGEQVEARGEARFSASTSERKPN